MVSKIDDSNAAPRVSAGLKVAESLHAAEAAVDAALVEAQALSALTPASDRPAPAKAVSRARIHLARAHKTLADVARRIGLDETTVGPLDKPEDTPPIGSGPRRRKPA